MTVTNKPNAGDPIVVLLNDAISGNTYIPTREFWNFLDELSSSVNNSGTDVSDKADEIFLGAPVDNSADDISTLENDLDADLGLIAYSKVTDLELTTYSISADRTTEGNELIRSTASADVYLNASPEDGEKVVVLNGDGGNVTSYGNGKQVNGFDSLTITQKGNSITMIYYEDFGGWVAS